MQCKVNRKVETEYVSVKDAELMTGRSRWSWRRDAYEGKIASVKLGASLLLPLAEIRRLIAENTRPAVVENGRGQTANNGVKGGRE